MFTFTELILAIAVPAVFAAVIAWLFRGLQLAGRLSLAAGFGIACGILALNFNSEWNAADAFPPDGDNSSAFTRAIGATATKAIRPRESKNWLVVLLPIAGVGSVIGWTLLRPSKESSSEGRPLETATRRRSKAIGMAVLWIGLISASIVRMLWGSVYFLSQWSRETTILYVATIVFLLILTAWMLSIQPSTGSTRNGWRFGLLTLVLGATTVTMMMSGSLSLAIVGVCITSAATASGFLSCWNRGTVALDGWFWSLSIGSLLVLGHFFAELRLVNALLLLAAVAMSGFPFSQIKSRQSTFWVQVILCVALAGAAVGLASATLAQSEHEQSRDTYGYGGLAE